MLLTKELERHPDLIKLKAYVIMPDHVHLRLYLTPGQANALRGLGQRKTSPGSLPKTAT